MSITVINTTNDSSPLPPHPLSANRSSSVPNRSSTLPNCSSACPNSSRNAQLEPFPANPLFATPSPEMVCDFQSKKRAPDLSAFLFPTSVHTTPVPH